MKFFNAYIKIIFVMDARVNVNIDVFVLNFYWTDLQGEKKNTLKLIISFFLNISLRWKY